MILVDRQIREAVRAGTLGIENFAEGSLQPASYDLRVGPLVYSAAQPDPTEPVDISHNGGVYRIPPYGNALLMTYETLRLPAQMIGRFGLKSGLTRKGLFASAGPQVDPGFEGKLFVSLLNLTPASRLISYREEFLSIEFHTLDQAPDATYHGPYQGKSDVGREVLDDLVRLEGVNLSQMQSQFTELAQHVREWSALAGRFDEFLRTMQRHTTAIEKLMEITLKRFSPSEGQPTEARQLTPEEASREILELFRRQGRLYYSDIAEALRLDMATVIEACESLERRGLIEGA